MTDIQTAVELMIARTVDIARQSLGNLIRLVEQLEATGKQVVVCDKRASSVHHASQSAIREWYAGRLSTVTDGHLINIAVADKGRLPVTLTANLVTGSIALANNGSSTYVDVLPSEHTMKPACRDNGTPIPIDAYRRPMTHVIYTNNHVMPRCAHLLAAQHMEVASLTKSDTLRIPYDAAMDAMLKGAMALRSLRVMSGLPSGPQYIDSLLESAVAGSLSVSRCLSGESDEVDEQLIALISYFCGRADVAELEELGRSALSTLSDSKMRVAGRRVGYHDNHSVGIIVRVNGSVLKLTPSCRIPDHVKYSRVAPAIEALWDVRKPSKAT